MFARASSTLFSSARNTVSYFPPFLSLPRSNLITSSIPSSLPEDTLLLLDQEVSLPLPLTS